MSPGLHDLTRGRGLLFGGDYNPEQWPEEVWAEDVRLMKEAGVNLVTVGVFSWARIEPEPGVRDFGWLDRVLGLLAAAGVAVDLATPTASPPPWLGHRWPETLPVDESGHRLWYGSRNQFCPSSPVYRERALALVNDLAGRYAGHPALAMWHVGNEYGQVCHCDTTAEAFRAWLRGRHGDLDALNEAWGTAFWSQRYSAWEEVLPPRRAPYLINPAQRLDFRRFCSDALLDHFRAERDLLRAHTPDIPVTTNFMGFFPLADYWSWAPEEDVVSNDWYPDPADPLTHVRAALTHDLMRSLAGGGPWILMEQSVSAVNWRPHNLPKPPGRLRLESLQAVARGADGLCYFQWRASRSGSERFHSAMLPHAGPDTRLHREVRAHGAELRSLAGVAGTRVPARVALVFDWPSWWAATERGLPSDRLDPVEELFRYYRPFWERGVSVDVVRPSADLSGYALVVAPGLFLLGEDDAASLTSYVRGGGTLAAGPFSAVADRDARVYQGRFPVPLREVLGVSGEEWLPVPEDRAVRCAWADGGAFTARLWTELVRAEGAEPVAVFDGGDPAILRHSYGAGTAWYVATLPEHDALTALAGRLLADAGVTGALPGPPPPGVEAVRRGPVLFLLNHGSEAARVPIPGPARDLLTGAAVDGPGQHLTLAPQGVAVLRTTEA